MKTVFVLLLLLATAQQTFEEQLADAESSYKNRNFPEAIEKFAPLLKHFEKSQDTQKIADITFKIGRSNRRLGNFTEALELLHRAMKLHTKIGDQQGLGFDLTEIAIAHQRQGDYEESIRWSQKAMAIHEPIRNLVGIAKTQEVFGLIYYRKGEYEKSLEYFERATSAGRESGDKEVFGIILGNLGQVYWAKGDYTRALESYKKAEELAREVNDLNSIATNLANSALVHWDQGNLKQAATDLERAHEIFRQVGNLPLEATSLLNLGSLQLEFGNYAAALDAYRKSLEMAKNLGDKGLESAVLNSIAMAEREIGNYDSALNHVRRSLALAEEIGEKSLVTEALDSLANISADQGNDRAALEYYRKALQIDREAGLKRKIHVRLLQLGNQFAKLGEFDKALEHYKEAIFIQESNELTAHAGWTFSAIGSVYRKQNHLVEADLALTKAIDRLQDAGMSDRLWPALYNKGLVSRDMGKLVESKEWMKKAVEVIEGIREGVGLPEQRSSYLEKRLDVYEDTIALLVQLGDLPEAYEYLQRSKSRAFLDLLSEARIDPQAGLDSSRYNEKRRLLAKLVRLNRLIKEEHEKEKPNKNVVRQLEKSRSETDQEYVKLLLELRRQNPRLAEIQDPQILQLAEAQALLDDNSVLLDYFVGKKESMVFAISTRGLQLYKLPGEARLNQQIQELLETLQKPEPVWEATDSAYSRYAKIASALYQQILKPAETEWKSKSRIMIAADGSLNYLPFEILLTARTDPAKIDFSKLPYFALHREIQYVPSISAFAAIVQNARESRVEVQKSLIAFADPLAARGSARTPVGDQTIRDWSASLSELPYARLEVEQISRLYPKETTSILIGKDASESNAKGMRLDEFKTVHLASHGLIDEERPQLSSVVLNAGSPQEDGYLTMREVFDLKLNADLVVLSACKTGLGKQIRGEGVTGLARAFFCAGASSILVSLWNVNDRSTADFMTDFYSNCIQHGMSKTVALKEARLKMIGGKKYSHPYYWSPFILIGSS